MWCKLSQAKEVSLEQGGGNQVMDTWRERARITIWKTARENSQLPETDMRIKISDAYPFCERRYYPYQAWLAEVKLYFNPAYGKKRNGKQDDKRQSKLF